MRVIFTVSAEWAKDLQRMKQFEICLMGQRMMSPNCRMIVQIPIVGGTQQHGKAIKI